MAAQPASIRDEVIAAPSEPLTVNERCAALGISKNFLSEFIGISNAELSRSLKSNDRPIQINHALCQLENLVMDFAPVPLRFDGNADQVRELVRTSVTMAEENRAKLRGALSAFAEY